MVILAILASFAAIGLLCWLLFTLAVFALPMFVGVTTGAWAHGTGAGIPGAVLVGAAAALTLAAGHLLITFVRPMWLKLLVGTAFVAPAAIAGFAWHCEASHAVRGMADQLLRPRCDRCRHHRLRAGRRNGGGPGPVRPESRASLIVIVAVSRARPDQR